MRQLILRGVYTLALFTAALSVPASANDDILSGLIKGHQIALMQSSSKNGLEQISKLNQTTAEYLKKLPKQTKMTASLKHLISQHKQAKTYEWLHQRLKECGAEENGHLIQKVLSGAKLKATEKCVLSGTNLQSQLEEIRNVTLTAQEGTSENEELRNVIKNEARQHAVRDTLHSYWHIKTLIPPKGGFDCRSDSVTTDFLKGSKATDIEEECRHFMGSKQALNVQEFSGRNRYQRAAAALNQEIKTLNSQVEKIKEFRSPTGEKPPTEINEALYAGYTDDYSQLASSNLGRLLVTDRLWNKVGAMQTPDSSEFEKGQFHPEAHKAQVTYQDIQVAHRQAVRGLKDRLNSLKNDEFDLEDLLIHHPTAVGRALMEHPQSIQQVCSTLETKAFQERWLKRSLLAVDLLTLPVGLIPVAGWGVSLGAQVIKRGALKLVRNKMVQKTTGRKLAVLGSMGGGTFALGNGVAFLEASSYEQASRKALVAAYQKEGYASFAKDYQQALDNYNNATFDAVLAGAVVPADAATVMGSFARASSPMSELVERVSMASSAVRYRLTHGSEKVQELAQTADLRSTETFTQVFSKVPGYNISKVKKVKLADGREVKLGKMIGEPGAAGAVFCIDDPCKQIIKLPRSPWRIQQVTEEIEIGQVLDRAGVPTAKILNSADKDPVYLIKEFVPGPSLGEAAAQGMSQTQIKSIATMFNKIRDSRVPVDIGWQRKDNIRWHPDREEFVLIDNGLWGERLIEEQGIFDAQVWAAQLFAHDPKAAQTFLSLTKDK